ncbi:kinase-like domain-containing protein [Mycena floridula]|nr:kinase-like domain-containing protein [Mycena floridula]
MSALTYSPSQALIASSTRISQGAEAKVYKAYLSDRPILLKHRFPKQYRHPALDGPLTKSRIAGEARAILRCLKANVNVPGIRMVDASEGILGLEWIDGQCVRKLLPGGAEEEDADEDDLNPEDEDPLQSYGISVDGLMTLIGSEIAKMHRADVVHGDLTTSNMMLRSGASSQGTTRLVLIDFGLSYQSNLVEDKAVDLYVLERAFSSTHPDAEPMFSSVLKAYEKTMGAEWFSIKKRLDDVRLRGRKRSMVG